MSLAEVEQHGSASDVGFEIASLLRELIVYKYRERGERNWRILEKLFGLNGKNLLNDAELGRAFCLERARIGQIKQACFAFLKHILVHHDFRRIPISISPHLLQALDTFYDGLSMNTRTSISMAVALEGADSAFDAHGEDLTQLTSLLLTVAGYEIMNFRRDDLADIWSRAPRPQRHTLKEQIRRLNQLLTYETALAIDAVDILACVNDGLTKDQAIALGEVVHFASLCSSVEPCPDGTFRGKFEYLEGRVLQTERILSESSKPMSVQEITREINHRLALLGKRKLADRNLANQIADDPRFITIGKSGFRGLASWTGIDSKTIVEVMEDFLTQQNKPATEQEIYDYVSSHRPVEIGSIEIYLVDNPRFRRYDHTHWGLSAWPDAPKTDWGKAQVAAFVASVFKQYRTRELEYQFLKEALMAHARVSDREARGLLNTSPALRTYLRAPGAVRYAILQPDYEANLSRKRHYQRKQLTLLERVSESTRQLLLAAPGHALPLASIKECLAKTYERPPYTIYQYIGRLDFVDKETLPGTRIRICRLNEKALGNASNA